jgi:hypothetical protein
LPPERRSRRNRPTSHTPLATRRQEASQTGTERAGALNREHSPTRGVPLGELECLRIAVAARDDRRLENNHPTNDVHDRERMRVTVRVDTDDVVQLICKHPRTDPQRELGDTTGVGLGMETAGGRTVTGHAPTTRTGF